MSQQVTLPMIGTFCWPELSTSDVAGAQAFYGELLGWNAFEVPTAMGNYVILRLGDRETAGLCAQAEDQCKHGVPPHWLPYVAVANADATAAKAVELGGKVLASPFDVMDVGRMAIIQDPVGATFALWQAKNHKGVGAYGEAGALCWTELATKDTVIAQRFYTGLFGWEAMAHTDGMPYTEWKLNEAHFGGMLGITSEWGPHWEEIPSHWMVYFMVKDVDERTQKAQALGAKVCIPPHDIPNVGRFAMLQDPQGAKFSIFQGKV